MRAAELQNSSLSSADHMRNVWPKLVNAHVNTVLGAVTWEQIEPTEGVFKFDELDKIITDARLHGLHLVLLWFGSFKNGRLRKRSLFSSWLTSVLGLSTYTPAWVKTDAQRFPRTFIQNASGSLEVSDVLSVFNGNAQKADARAFKALMHHLKKIDEEHSTVLMLQVQNEAGLLGDSRDRSARANSVFESPVPEKFIHTLDKTWDSLHESSRCRTQFQEFVLESVFGSSQETDEIFMTYHYALYLEEVVVAGKKAYSIPMYTKVCQNYADEDGDDGENGFPVVVGGGGNPGELSGSNQCSRYLAVFRTFTGFHRARYLSERLREVLCQISAPEPTAFHP